MGLVSVIVAPPRGAGRLPGPLWAHTATAAAVVAAASAAHGTAGS